MTEVAIIIVNYNTIELVKELIESITKHVKLRNYRIVIVDNNSKDRLTDLQKISKVKVIKNKRNTGFAGGNNIGIRAIKAKYYCLINPDVLLINDAVSLLKKAMEKKSCGIAGPAIYDSNKRPDHEYYNIGSVLYEISKIFKLNWIYLKNYQKRYQQDLAEVEWVTGAFFMVRGKVIRDIGYFDEGYFLYSEEADYCIRAGQAGWKIIRARQPKIIHLECGSTQKISGFRLYYQYRSKLRFIRKFFGRGAYLLLKCCYFLDIAVKLLIRGILEKTGRGRQNYAQYYFKLLKEMVNNEI